MNVILPQMRLRGLVMCLFLFAVSRGSGQSVWTGTVDGEWGTAGNWSGTTPGNDSTLGLTFTGIANTITNNSLTGFTASSLVFDNTLTAGVFNLAGNQITLSGNISTLGATGTPQHTISLNLVLNANRLITTELNNNLTISGIISGSGFGLTKEGAGLLRLDGSNSFTGPVVLNAGTLMATTSANALGSGAATLIHNGGILHMANDVALAFGRATTVAGDVTWISDRLSSAATSTTHTIGPLTIGANTLRLERGSNITSTSTGNVTVVGGTTLTGNATFAPQTRTTLNLGTVNDGGNGYSLTATGSGTGATLTLTGAGAWSGGTVVNSGTLRVDSADGLGANGVDALNPTVTTVNGGTLRLGNGNTARNNRLIDFQGTGTLFLVNTSATTWSIGQLVHSAGSLTISSAKATAGGTAVNHTLNNALPMNGNLTLTTTADVNLLLGGAISEQSGTTNVTKTGVGMVRLGVANTYSGLTTVSNGELRINAVNAIPSGPSKGDFTMNPASPNTATFNLNGFNQTLNGFSSSGAGTSVVNNGGVAAATLTIGANDGGGTFSGILQNTGGALSLRKTGAGVIKLNGSGTYTGATSVDGGVLSVLPAVLSATSVLNIGTAGNGVMALYEDNAGAALNLPANVNLNLGGATTWGGLAFQLGSNTASSDRILLSGLGTLSVGAGGGLISAYPLSGFGAGSYDLISGPNNIVGGSNLALGNLPGGFIYTLDTTTDLTKLTLVAAAVAAGQVYWTGDVNGSWSQLTGGNTNWSTLPDGSVEAGYTPGVDTMVHFSASNAGPGPVNTTLDNAYSIAGLTILNSGTGAVSIAPGLVGSLTLGAGGIDIQAGAPALTSISAPVVLGSNQVWNVADVGSSLAVSGVVSGAGNLAKNGAGSLTLSALNTLTGQVSLNAGTLRVTTEGDSGLGSGTATLVIAGGILQIASDTGRNLARPTTISGNATITSDRITAGAGVTHTLGTLSIGAQTVSVQAGANPDSGIQGLTFGATTLTGTPTFEVLTNGNGADTRLILTNVTDDGNGHGLNKTGDGILRLSGGGTSTYSGPTLISAGYLEPSTTNALSPNSAHTVNGTGVIRLISGSTAIGSLAGSGLVENGGGSGRTLTTGGDNTSTTFSGTFQNGGSAAFAVTKVGDGTMSLTGTSTALSGTLAVNGGTVAVSGTFDNTTAGTTVGSSAGTQGTLRLLAGADYSTTTISVGNSTTGLGSLVIRGGDFATTTATTSSGVSFGNGGYGGIFMSSGTLSTRRLETSTSSAASALAVLQVSGGTLSTSEWLLFRNNRYDFTVTGGEVNRVASSQNLGLVFSGSATAFGAMTVAGGTVNNTGRSVTFGQQNNNTALATGVLNLNGGTLTTNSILTFNAANSATQAIINFNGGTLQAATHSADFIGFSSTGGSSTMALYSHGAFGSFAGGAVIDSNAFNVTLAQPILAPTGSGVSAIPLTSAGSGYIGAPIVEITGDGVGATAFATVDLDPTSGTFGQVTGITITNPGVGYTSAPTVTLVGGGGAGATVGAIATVANVSGGLTKIGNGTLTLTAPNTFTGATLVNGGTLSIAPSALPNTSLLHVGATGNASFDLFQDGAGAGFVMATDANLTLGSLSTWGALGFDLGTSSDTIALSGTGVFSIQSGGGVINANAISGFGAGTYSLVTSGNAIVGGGNLTLGFMPSGFGYTLDHTTNPNILSLVVSAAVAGDVFWRGDVDGSWANFNSGDTNWATSDNGLIDAGFIPGVANTINFSATNAGTGAIVTTLDNAISIQGLKLLNSGTGAVSIAPGVGGTLEIGSGGIQIQTGAPLLTTISAPVIIGVAQNWSVVGGNELLLSGAVSGSGALQLIGGGTVNLTAANTFTGNVVVDGSATTLGFTTAAALNIGVVGAQTYTVQNGGTFLHNGAVNINPTATSMKSFVIGSGGGTIHIAEAAGILTLDDPDQFSGTGNLIKSGPGTLVLGATSTAFTDFTGTLVTVAGGELRLGGNEALGAAGSQAAIALEAGVTLHLRRSATVNFGSNVTINGDATLLTNRASAGTTAYTHTLGALSIGGHSLTVQSGDLITSGTMTAAFGNATLSGNATINVAAGLAGAATQVTLVDVGETGGSRSLTKTGPGTLIINGTGVFTGGLIINEGILRGVGTSPAGSTVAPATNPFGSNSITLNGGTLQVRDNGDGTTGSQSLTYLNPVVVNGDATVNVDRVASPSTTKTIRFGRLTLADGVTFTTSAGNSYAQFYNSTAGNINTLLGNVTFNVTSGTANLGNAGSTTSSTNVSLTDSGNNFGLTKTGNGTLVLGRTTVGGLVQADAGILQLNSSGNLFPGGILVNGGTLLINAGNGVLGTATSPDVQVAEGSLVRLQNTTGAQNVGFDFQGSATLSLRASTSATFQVESLNIEAGASEFTFSVVRSTSTGDPNNHTMTFQGPITTNGPLVFNATGSNGYQAATSASSTLVLGGDIAFNPTTTNLTLNGVISETGGARSVSKTGESTLTLSAANTYTGGTTVNAGTLLVNNTSGSGTGSGDLSVAIGGTLGGSGIVASSNTSAAVTIQGLLDVGNPGDTGGADLAFNLTGGSSSISLGGVVQLDLWSGLGLGGGVGTAFSDQLWLSANSIDLTGSTLKLTNSSGMSNSTFAVGDTWKLFDWNAVAFTGSFSNITSGSGNFLDLPDLDPYGLAWDTSELYTTGHIAVGVPEPSRTLLLMVGLLIFGLRRRRWL